MSLEMFKELTNDQLKEECQELGITVTGAKNPAKPTKDDYLKAIKAKLEGIPEGEEVTLDVPKVVKRKEQSPSQLMRLDMFRKDRVMIHDIQSNQTNDKDEILPVSWGNRLLGGQTDFVSLSGEPQYVRRGALGNIRGATTVIHEPNPSGNGVSTKIVKRFIVTEVDGLTPKELEELANKQKMRNAKYA